jgi:hypothetical protein
MQAIRPWLNDSYIKRTCFNGKGNFTIMFVDGGQKVYQVDGCTEKQLEDVFELMKENGVPVSK